jgi:trk system potassium uptake protein TrkH
VRLYLGLVLLAVLLVTGLLWLRGVYTDPLEALRFGAFNVVSVATTTGYATADYGQWPAFAPWLMLLLGCVATCGGSTGGGIKMIRLVLLVKQSLRELVRIVHPNVVNPLVVNGRAVPDRVIHSVIAFMMIYGATLVAMTMLLVASGLDVVTAFSAVVACLNNIGPGLGEVGPSSNFGVLTDFQTWVCSIAMMLGRLELLSIMVLFTPQFWRK